MSILQKLLEESGIINDETKTQILEQFEAIIEETRQTTEEAVKAELVEAYVKDRQTLMTALDEQVQEAVNAYVAEMRDDLAAFRDLEVEYNERLVEQEKALAIKAQKDINELVEALDGYITLQLEAEVEDLKESLDQALKMQKGQRIFEAFVDEYKEFYVESDSAVGRVATLEAELTTVLNLLAESESHIDALNRNSELNALLSPLSGNAKEVMESLLQNVPTENLQESFDKYVDRVISASNEHTTTLNESHKTTTQQLNEGVVRNGDQSTVEQMLNEGKFTDVSNKQSDNDYAAYIRKLRESKNLDW